MYKIYQIKRNLCWEVSFFLKESSCVHLLIYFLMIALLDQGRQIIQSIGWKNHIILRSSIMFRYLGSIWSTKTTNFAGTSKLQLLKHSYPTAAILFFLCISHKLAIFEHGSQRFGVSDLESWCCIVKPLTHQLQVSLF